MLFTQVERVWIRLFSSFKFSGNGCCRDNVSAWGHAETTASVYVGRASEWLFVFVGTQRGLFKLQPHWQCKCGSYFAAIENPRPLTHANTPLLKLFTSPPSVSGSSFNFLPCFLCLLFSLFVGAVNGYIAFIIHVNILYCSQRFEILLYCRIK